ncbi:MAG TPA: YidC/Oxa1 family insertase periplasmic-domain containing protein [Blastocatellia bacterium]|nr:YidC/Oxa1 family insertase periplasmic-domain containing protein [Blastocatellia bacterium]
MDRNRLILALALSLVVLMSWPLVMRYLAPPPPIEETINFEEQAAEPPAQPQKSTTPPAITKGPSQSPAAQAQPQTTQVEPREITIHTPNWVVKMSNRGAIATSWKLLKYVENGQVRNITGADGGELELIPQSLPPGVDTALSLRTPWSPEVGSQLNNVNFQIEGVAANENEIRLEKKGDTRKVTFSYVSPTLTATKSFTFFADGFVFDVTAEARSSSGEQAVELVLGPRFGDQSDKQTSSYSTPPQFVAYTRDTHRLQIPGPKITPPFATITNVDHGANQIDLDKPASEGVTQIKIEADKGANFLGYAKVLSREANGKRLTLETLPAGTAKGNSVAQGSDTLRSLYRWAGITDHYFAMLAVPDQAITEVTLTNIQVKQQSSDTHIDYPAAAVPITAPTHIFVGPKDRELLAAVGSQLNANLPDLIDYGMFSFAVRPLIPALAWALNGLARVFGNYGWAIVGVTVIINLALSPLRFYSSKKMKKAAKHQPKMKELQDRMKKLKENPKKNERELQDLQQEQLALMKEANPLGGCMPLLLQMPIFWAVYLYLGSSLDVRHAPWVLWLTDLSRPDPYKILPIVMCVTMIASTKLTPQPASADPSMKMQRVMMTWLMPIMLTWLFFFSAPSGLVLYWMVSNIVGVLIQLWINRKTADLAAEAAAAAASTGSKTNKAGSAKNAKDKPGKRRQERPGGAEA